MGEFRKQDWIIILQILSNMFRMFGIALVIPTIVALYYGENSFAFLFFAMAVILTLVFSVIKKYLKIEECDLKHAIASLALAWVLISLISAVPFMFFGMKFVDSFFESFSGWTGTGLTMVADPANLPFTLNFWRGFIQWVGGFGIVILALLLYERPKTAQALFLAEGRTEGFFVSFLSIARIIVLIYSAYTAAGILLMWFSGMTLFDSAIHSLTSIATGGFSTNSIGIGAYGTFPMVVSLILMIIGGTSFVSHYYLIRGKIKDFFKNPELIILYAVIAICFILVALEIYLIGGDNYFDGLFYVISSVTGSGHTTTIPLDSFPAVTLLIFIFLMICGASYGSTTGAVKLWRMIIVLKIIRRQVIKVFLPEHAVTPIMVRGVYINEEDALKTVSYIFLYLALLFLGSVVFMFFGYSMVESIFTVASAQGNVGLNIIPAQTYYFMHPLLKLQLIFHMLLGRVEIIPFLVLLRGLRFVKRT